MFKLGDVVVFDPTKIKKEYWESLSEESRVLFYGPFGYAKYLIYFCFLTQVDTSNYCVLINLTDDKIYPMCPIEYYRKTTKEEF